jgi:Zn finger protein HypA/HybF involved in hydrogenase expression
MTIKCPNCNHTFEYNILEDVNTETESIIRKHMKYLDDKFKMDNPCPKCGSYNVDLDWGTPMWCIDCGYEWGD